MSWHRKTKTKHEAAEIDKFVGWLNQTTGSNWIVTDRPNPPDAIIKNNGVTSWIEQADLHRSGEEARSLMSFLNPDQPHMPHSEEPIIEPDIKTACAFITLLRRKLSKPAYRSAYEDYGQGLLLISERDPLFDNSTISEIKRITEKEQIVGDMGYFSKVYLAIRERDGICYSEVTYLKV